MVKRITGEMYNEAVSKICRASYIDSGYNVLLKDVFSSIFKSQVYFADLTFDDSKLSEKGYKQLEEFILSEDFREKYGLYPMLDRVFVLDKNSKSIMSGLSDIMSNSLEGSLKVYPTYLTGEGFIIELKETRDVIIPNGIYYTSEVSYTVLEVLKTIRETLVNLDKIDGDIVDISLFSNNGGRISNTIESVLLDQKITLSEFNEDFPNEEINEFLENDKKSGVCIFHGQPGCGKTSYIRYLMKSHPDLNFAIVSQGLFLSSLDELKNTFIRRRNKNTVYIVEDCENLLRSREDRGGNTSALSDILNFLDGILGDIVKTKFIFTFNTKINQIDSALLRKGRCVVNYEFSPLIGKNLEITAKSVDLELTDEEIKNGLTLAQIYHHEDLDCTETKPKRKLGFC